MSKQKHAAIIAINNSLEHNTTVVYRSIFIGETLSLINSIPGWQCDSYDQLMQNLKLTDFLKLFTESPDLILLWADVHHSEQALQLARLAKKVTPLTKILVFGRSTTFIPQYFQRQPFDAVHVSGDREASIVDFVRHLDGLLPIQAVSGISYESVSDGIYLANKPRALPEPEWPLPSLDRLPVAAYRAYVDTVHGERYSKRVSVTAAKGCTWNCAYCGATQEEGAVDRRRNIEKLLNWTQSTDISTYESYLHLYAPDLFYDADWIAAFCTEYLKRGLSFAWRGVTTTRTLQDSRLLKDSGSAGCRELAIGVEHIDSKKLRALKSTLEEIARAAHNCKNAGVNLKALVMLGYKNQTESDVDFTIEYLTSLGLTIRFTGYTPLQSLTRMTTAKLDQTSLQDYDRRTFFDEKSSKISREYFYKRIVLEDGYVYP